MQSNLIESKGVPLRCPKGACRHSWNYRGQSTVYTSCPFCRTNVHVVKNRIESQQPASVVETKQAAVTAQSIPEGTN